MASHRSLSCLPSVKLFISRRTTGVNNKSPVHYDTKCKISECSSNLDGLIVDQFVGRGAL